MGISQDNGMGMRSIDSETRGHSSVGGTSGCSLKGSFTFEDTFDAIAVFRVTPPGNGKSFRCEEVIIYDAEEVRVTRTAHGLVGVVVKNGSGYASGISGGNRLSGGPSHGHHLDIEEPDGSGE